MCCWSSLIFGYYCFVCCIITFSCMRLVVLLAGAWVLTNCSLGRMKLADLVQSLMGISGSTYRGMDTLLALEGPHCLLSPLNLLRAPSPIIVSALLLAMQHHPNQRLASYILSGLTNGFHISFDHRCRLRCNGRNHPSTTEHPLIVQQHIEVKQARGSLVGALPPSWLLQSILVPWGWVPKPQSDKW